MIQIETIWHTSRQFQKDIVLQLQAVASMVDRQSQETTEFQTFKLKGRNRAIEF